MKLYLKQNVWDAALDRIRWLFDEFENVVVNFSGGKDSTVTLHLALQVAEEKGRLPLPVFFLDQEAEWDCVIDYVRDVMADPRVKPIWLQCPFRIFNAASPTEEWLNCWEPGKQWIRPKEPNSIHDNVFGSDRFGELFEAVIRHYFPGGNTINLAGVRAEESPARLKGLTSYETYKGETWGKKRDPKLGYYDMYPLYDWSYTDVWKAIHDNGWAYCKLYDYMYQYGVPVANMRVSNVTHETALKSLFFLQEVEGDTWNRITERLAGINTVGQMKHQFLAPKELPPMFRDWREYRDYLVDNLAPEEHRPYFRKTFAREEERFLEEIHHQLFRMQIGCVITNDYHGTKNRVFQANHGAYSRNAGTKGGDQSGLAERGFIVYDRTA